jgi:hypothetical protein
VTEHRSSRASRTAVLEEADAVTDVLKQWRDPVWNKRYQQIPVRLVPRLTEMATEVAHTDLGHRIYYERVHALLVVASVASRTDPAALQLDGSPSDAEKHLGSVFGQAFHQGLSLADLALAAQLPADQIVAIGKRTIRRTNWLKRL